MSATRTRRLIRFRFGRCAAGLATVGIVTLGGLSGGNPARAARGSTDLAANKRLHAMLPKSIQQAGKLQDIINLPYPPMEFTKPGTTRVIGFDIDMATAIAKKLGVKIQFQNVLFPQIFPSVKTRRGNFAWTSVFDLKAREKTFSFIDYFKTGSQLFTSAANAGTFKSLKSLCGKTVAVPTGTNFGQVVKQVSKATCGSPTSMNQVTVQSPTEQELQVREGRADAAISGVETVLYLMKQQPGKWSLVGKTVQPEYYAVVFPKNAKQLQSAMLAAMKVAWRDGTYRRILARWGFTRNGLPRPLVNRALG